MCTCGMAASRSGIPERCSCVPMRIWIGTGGYCGMDCPALLLLMCARRLRLSLAMIAGEPLLQLRNFHGMLTNISRHRPERQTRVLNLKTCAEPEGASIFTWMSQSVFCKWQRREQTPVAQFCRSLTSPVTAPLSSGSECFNTSVFPRTWPIPDALVSITPVSSPECSCAPGLARASSHPLAEPRQTA